MLGPPKSPIDHIPEKQALALRDPFRGALVAMVQPIGGMVSPTRLAQTVHSQNKGSEQWQQ